MLLDIQNLKASVAEKEVLRGLSLKVNPGEVHAIMGPNGSGKSSLARVVAGHPGYQVTGGEVRFQVHFKEVDLLAMDPDQRAKEGLFLAFQYPVEIPGVTNLEFLLTAYNAMARYQGFPEMKEEEFLPFVKEKMELVKMDHGFLKRSVNDGFSGGEKKRNEILQMAILNPRLAFLDETDSGLDIDALKIVAEGVNRLRSPENGIILVTHYQRLLDHIQPDFVHVLAKGEIIKSGGPELALKLEAQGYDWLH